MKKLTKSVDSQTLTVAETSFMAVGDELLHPDFPYRVRYDCWASADVAEPYGAIDLDDILVVLQAFAWQTNLCPWVTSCPGTDGACLVDICNCRTDGMHVIDLDDILAVLKAFQQGIVGPSSNLCSQRFWSQTPEGPVYQRLALFVDDEELPWEAEKGYVTDPGVQVVFRVLSSDAPWQ